MMIEGLYNLPVALMTLAIFAATYVVAAGIYWAVTRLAMGDRARAFKALSPGMLPPLGIIFGLLVAFVAAQVWSDFDRARVAVASEASALRGVVLLASNFPGDEEARLRALVGRHIDAAVREEWPAMAGQHAFLTTPSAPLVEALQRTLALTPITEGQKIAQREIVGALQNALDGRRQRIIISQSTVNGVKWMGLLLQALCALIAIALVHSDNRLACAIALALFSTGVALSVLLIASHNRPFTGDISIGPEILMQVMPEAVTPDAKP
jgi:hypothetical protein